jgi:hypothetical protein
MNAINRIGQRVVCISGWNVGCSQITRVPEINKEYTVDGFGDTEHGTPGLYLREITVHCKCRNKILTWDIAGFRPVDERKTDISQFTELLDATPVKVPETV